MYSHLKFITYCGSHGVTELLRIIMQTDHECLLNLKHFKGPGIIGKFEFKV